MYGRKYHFLTFLFYDSFLFYEKLICLWWRYIYLTISFYYNSYEVEFSKPKNIKPIPEGTVKVYFSVIEGVDAENHEVEFNFENESLKHKKGNTMR